MVIEPGMLRRSERKLLLNKLNGLEVDQNYLRVVKSRIKRRLIQAMYDLQLIYAVFPDLQNVTGVTVRAGPGGLEPPVFGSGGRRPIQTRPRAPLTASPDPLAIDLFFSSF